MREQAIIEETFSVWFVPGLYELSQRVMVMSPVELGTKNHRAGESQQQFT
jgi:hypothetical protein